MTVRVLLVRSGENSVAPSSAPPGVEIVEKISHTIEPLAQGIEALDEPADLAIFTSQIAVRRLCGEDRLREAFGRAIRGGRIAAVGTATAEALAGKGFPPAIVARGSAEGVLERLPTRLEGQRVLLPRGVDASEELAEGLVRRGARVAPVILYRKIPRPADARVSAEVASGSFAGFCTTSPAAARWLFAGLSREARAVLLKTPAVVLGRFTGRFLSSQGVVRVETAREASLSSAVTLLAAIGAEGAAAGPLPIRDPDAKNIGEE